MSSARAMTVDDLLAGLPGWARDVKLNLQSVLASGGALTDAQRWGVALAAAIASRHVPLTRAISAAAEAKVGPEVLDDARAAASVMAMNNVYYRFRHQVGEPAYAVMAPRLRMNRLAQPSTSRGDLELFSLAVSAINGCEACVQAHERAVRDGGLTREHVHEAARVAAVLHAAAVSLEESAVTSCSGVAFAAPND